MKIIYTKLQLLIMYIALGLLLPAAQANESESIPIINNLQQFSGMAKEQNIPILILFSMEDCEWCEIIRDEYLIPMRKRQGESAAILIGEISIEDYNSVRDFDGKLMSADNIGLRYMADVSPTVVFINAKGDELVERITGFRGYDYYDYALDDAIQKSIKKNTE